MEYYFHENSPGVGAVSWTSTAMHLKCSEGHTYFGYIGQRCPKCDPCLITVVAKK